MANEPFRQVPPKPAARPKIWAEGGQRPPFDLRGFARSSLYFSRAAVAPILAWTARLVRRVAVNVHNGAGRIPEARLGRIAPYVPSHLRVAGWIKAVADILCHASASADPDILRGNALVAEIVPAMIVPQPAPQPVPDPEPTPEIDPDSPALAPIAVEDLPPPPHDPLAAIRDDLNAQPVLAPSRTEKAAPRNPPRIVTGTMATQIPGYLMGWLSVGLALPFGVLRALWSFAKGTDLRRIGVAD